MSRDTLHLLRFSRQEQRYIITNGGTLLLSLEGATREKVWEEWLNTMTSFAFEDRAGAHFTIRKERLRRGDAYWYAYRSIQGHTKKRYLGKAADLTLERLEEVSVLFMMEEKKQPRANLADQQQMSRMAPKRGRAEVAHLETRLLETKLHPPQLPTWLVERTRLLDRLDNSCVHKLTLLLAPAGFGKTTLVNQWLAARDSSKPDNSRKLQGPLPMLAAMAWVSLESSDNDPLRFWRYIVTASQRLLGPEQRAAGQAALEMLATTMHLPFEASPVDMALTPLLNALAASPSEGLLVLDDYHAIHEPHIHKTLAFFIDHLPATVHILLLSRSEPDLPLLRWRARGELYELHGSDLRFSPGETEAFLSRTLPATISETALNQLDSSLEGWAAGLRLLSLTLSRWRTPGAIERALLSLGEQTGVSQSYAGGAEALQRSLLDYFVTEILETQPASMQHFLLHTSVLSRLCTPLCDAITASEGSSERLAAVARAGLFLEALEGPGEWYRYHALFAEAMRREASRRLGEKTLQEGALRASLWYEQEGMLTEAIEAAWLVLDMERVARLIESLDIVNFYEPQTLRKWLERLPEEILRTHPMLCHLLAVELCFPVELRFSSVPRSELPPPSEAERARVQTLLQMAEDGWRKRDMLPWIGANRAFCALNILVNEEPFTELVDYAQQGLTFMQQEGVQDLALRRYRASCLLFVGIEQLRQGQIGTARQLLLQAQQDNVPPGNRDLAIDIGFMLGRSYLLQGELKLACRHLQQVFVDARELGDDEVAADALLELAWLAFEWHDLVGAEQQAREAQELARRFHPQKQELSDRAALQLALLHYARGESDLALEQLTALQARAPRAWTPRSFWLRSRLLAWHGRLGIAIGNVQATQRSLEAASQDDAMTTITDHLSVEMLRGRLWLAQGKGEDACQHLTHLLSQAQEHLHQYAALEIELLLALTFSLLKQEQQAHYWLRQALSQAMYEGYMRLFLNEGEPLFQLLRALLKSLPYDNTLRGYIQKILRATAHSTQPQALRPFQPSGAANNVEEDTLLLEPLSQQEQRVLRLLVAGRSNEEVARELVISINTVKYHTKHLYQKLGVSNRLQASEAARRLKLVELF